MDGRHTGPPDRPPRPVDAPVGRLRWGLVPEVGELEGEAEVGALEELHRGLQVIALLARHPDRVALCLALDALGRVASWAERVPLGWGPPMIAALASWFGLFFYVAVLADP